MPKLLNFSIMSSWFNWASVFLIVAFWAVAIALLSPQPTETD